MVSDKNMDRVSLICHATVCHMFAMFCNPVYRGPNFSWANFPEMMMKQCRQQVHMANIRGRNQQAIYDHAEQTGFLIAQRMVTDAGF